MQNTESTGVRQSTVHAVAAAQPGCLIDHRPSPGAFAVSIQGTAFPQASSLQYILTNSIFTGSPCDILQTPVSGDDPTAVLSNLTLPIFTDFHPSIGSAMILAFYDWIRRCGPEVNIQTLQTAIAAPIPNTAAGALNLYTKDVSGQITLQSNNDGNITPAVSQDQLIAVSGFAIPAANNHSFDIIVNDNALQARS